MKFHQPAKYFIAIIIAWREFIESEGILHSYTTYSYGTSYGGALVFENELCPKLHHRSNFDSWASIVLKHTYEESGKSPCVFNVTTLIANSTLKEAHPIRASIIGMFISEEKEIPWPTSIKTLNESCSIPLQIDILGLVSRQSQPYIPKPLCRVTNALFTVRRKVRHLQSSLWYQSSTRRLAFSVDKELEFTKASKQTKAVHFSSDSSAFAHLMFIFNSTGVGCFIRVEHYKINKNPKASCTSTEPTCDIFPCADELRLQLVTTDLWLRRGLRRNINQHHKLKPYTAEVNKDGGHPSVRVLISTWTPAVFCLYIFCRRKKFRTDTESEEEQAPNSLVPLECALENSVKDLPPTYSEVLEMDTRPPTYSDVCPTDLPKLLGFQRDQSLPINV